MILFTWEVTQEGSLFCIVSHALSLRVFLDENQGQGIAIDMLRQRAESQPQTY